MASLVMGAATGCAQEGDEAQAAASGSGADELVAQDVFDAAVVKADAIEFPAALVPAAVLARIEAYQKSVTPRLVSHARRDVFGRTITEQVVDMQDLLAQEQATGVEKVILRGDRQASVKPGQAIDEGATVNPSGYLRRALSYERRGDTVVVRTGPATLAEYFGELKVGQEALGQKPGQISAPLNVPFNFNLLDVADRQIFARSGAVDTPAGPVNGDVSLAIQRATLDLSGQLDVGIDIGFFSLNEAHLVLNGNVSGAIDFLAQANGTFATSTGDIALLPRPAKFALPPIGPVPLTLKVDVTAKCDLDVNGQATATVGGDVNVGANVGFEFRDGDTNFIGDSPGFNANLHPPQLSLSAAANARCAVVPTLEVLMFDAAGPQIGIEAFADGKFAAGAAFGARADAEASAQVSVGADFLVGGEIQAPLFDVQLLDFGTAKVLGVESNPAVFALPLQN